MKNINILLVSILLVTTALTCRSQSNQNDATSSTEDKVKMYYFHFSRRCATCVAVEEESQKAVNELYGDNISFASLNLEEEDGKKIGDKLGVSGQTLLIVSGDKKIDITNEGFMNARSNPDKLKQIIKEKIDPLVK
ncbi:MAG: hypothetical protein JXB49_03630 [Bacteroidales bacterium]|nr:hypothetical protein [Bacteroidales bacterium]